MRSDGGRQVRQRVEFLELARPHNREQPFDGALALVAPRAEHDFSPLHRRPKRALRGGMPPAGLCRVLQFSPDRIGAHRTADAA
jgi:hypothetical protein